MTLTIELTPAEEVSLAAVAGREGLDLAETAPMVLTSGLLPVADWEGLLVERGALLDRAGAGTLSDAQAIHLRQVEAQLDRLEDQDPVKQEADHRLARMGDKLDEVLALPRGLPCKDAEDAAR